MNLPPLRSRDSIPNTPGFTLILVRADGSRQLSRVAVDATGCHYCATPSGKRVDLTGKSDERPPVAGWLSYVPNKAPAVPGCVADLLRVHTLPELRAILAAWQCDEAPPRAGKCVVVAFPVASPHALAHVARREEKSPNGEALFNVWIYSRAA